MIGTRRSLLSLALSIWIFLSFSFTSPALAQTTETLRVATYNVESPRFCTPDRPDGQPSETEPALVAQRFQELAGPAVWALSEVTDRDTAEIYQAAANFPGSDFELLLGTQGTCFDLLAILYDRNQLTLLEDRQLIAEVGGDRDPLAARFRQSTNGTEFWVVANHFARGNENSRNQQATRLRNWVERRAIPVVVMGDMNMDYAVDLSLASTRPSDCPSTIEEGNTAFDIFTSSPDINWIQPQCLASGTCPPEGTGCFLPCFNSILDFVFIGGSAASDWSGTSEIGFSTETEYCSIDPEGGADHRPVLATLSYPVEPSGVGATTPQIRISELFPNPVGGSNVELRQESITLQNTGNTQVNLADWELRDRANQSWTLSGTIGAGQSMLFRRDGQPMALNNNGDSIELIDPTGSVRDSVTYTSTTEGESITVA